MNKGALEAKIAVSRGGKKGGPARGQMEGSGSELFV